MTVKILLREKFVTLFIFKLKKKLRLYIKKQRSSRKKKWKRAGNINPNSAGENKHYHKKKS